MIGSWFGKSLETVLKNNLSFAGEILMNIEQNSVKYDATKKQITVTTYYDKNLYFANCIKKLLWCRVKPLPNKLQGIFSVQFLRIFCLVGAVREGTVLLYLLYNHNFSVRIFVYFLCLFVFAMWCDKIICGFTNLLGTLNSRKPIIYRKSPANRYVAGVAGEFAKSAIFKQEVFISPSEFSVTSVFPDLREDALDEPPQREIKILKNDIFLLTYQVCGKHGKPAYLILLLDQSVHFNRKFYTEKDWKMLIEVMNEMQY